MIGPGVVRLTWAQGTTVQTCDAVRVVERVSSLVTGTPYALLIDLRQIASISLKAHHVFARDPLVLAAGMLGSGPMDRMLSAGSEQASHPAQYFVSELEAVRWLRSYLPASPPVTPYPASPWSLPPVLPAA